MYVHVLMDACQHHHYVVLVCWGLPWLIPPLVPLVTPLGVNIHSFHMQLRQAAVMNQSGLHVRYNAMMSPVDCMVDTYELVTYMVAAKSVPASLPEMQRHVLCPLSLWQTFGYLTTPFMMESRMRTLPELQIAYPKMTQLSSVRRAYALLLQLCCSSPSHFQQFFDVEAVIPPPHSHALFSPLHASATPVPPGCPPNLPVLIELENINGLLPPLT